MERLTFEGNFCDISKCGYLICPHDGNCSQKQVWERLKQFEDVFGTPEKAERVKLAFMGKAVYEIKEFDGVPIKRLIELAEADKDGRVVVLPCKVGDTVWFKTYKNSARECIGIQPHEVTRILVEIIVPGEFVDIGIPVDQIGTRVFLSEVEAVTADTEPPAESPIVKF